MLTQVSHNIKALSSAEDHYLGVFNLVLHEGSQWLFDKLPSPKYTWSGAAHQATVGLIRVAMGRILQQLVQHMDDAGGQMVARSMQTSGQLFLDHGEQPGYLSHTTEWVLAMKDARSSVQVGSLSRWAAFCIRDIERELAQSELVGKSARSARMSVKRVVARKLKDSVWRLERLLRTESSYCFHQAYQWALQSMNVTNLKKHLYYSSEGILLGQTRDIMQQFEDPEDGLFWFPPSHPNSRATMIGWSSDWDSLIS